MQRLNLIGQKFGRLLVTEQGIMKEVGITDKRKAHFVKCICDCGNIVEVRAESIKRITRSCGCLLKESIGSVNYKHGEAKKTKENNVWYAMKQRCYSPNCEKYPIYGGRGIQICDRWTNERGYENFLEDMGRCPQKNYSIDRIDVNGDYEPDNCRWVSAKTQANNTRKNVIVFYENEDMTLKQLSERLDIPYKQFHRLFRTKKLTIEQIKKKYGKL